MPKVLGSDLRRRRDDPLGWLEAVFVATAGAAPEMPAIGFVLGITDRPKVLEHVLLDSDIKLVLVHRANRLAQYAAARAAALAGYEVGNEKSAPVAFDRDDFLRFVDQQALACGLVGDLVADPSRLFVIEYRVIGNAAADAALLAFLGQEEAPLDVPDEPMSSPGIRERFADPDAVAAALEQTVWRPWLDRDGS